MSFIQKLFSKVRAIKRDTALVLLLLLFAILSTIFSKVTLYLGANAGGITPWNNFKYPYWISGFLMGIVLLLLALEKYRVYHQEKRFGMGVVGIIGILVISGVFILYSYGSYILKYIPATWLILVVVLIFLFYLAREIYRRKNKNNLGGKNKWEIN